MTFGKYKATTAVPMYEVIPVTDARSLWDATHRLSTTFQEKRVEIDVAALRQSCRALRWVPTEQQRADALTKRSASLRGAFRRWAQAPTIEKERQATHGHRKPKSSVAKILVEKTMNMEQGKSKRGKPGERCRELEKELKVAEPKDLDQVLNDSGVSLLRSHFVTSSSDTRILPMIASDFLRATLLAFLAGQCSSTSLLQKSNHLTRHIGPTSIPCVIHQTWKTHQLEGIRARQVDGWKKRNPGCEHKLWDDAEVEQLVRTKSPDVIWPIWNGLLPVEHADVFRYLVLYDQGGYYADLDVGCSTPIDQFPVPKNVSMILAYESGSRLRERDRQWHNFSRVEQFQNWFMASAPGNPVLRRALDIIREKFTWQVQTTLDLTGPGTLSDAVHEFLATTSSEKGVPAEISRRTNYSKKHIFPSENLYESGNQTVWLMAAGRVGARLQFQDDPVRELMYHSYAGTWKKSNAWLLELKILN
eukprot:s2496_g2.t1